MSFAAPLAFALTALAIPIVIFYILRVRLRRVPVSTNLFWRQIYRDQPPRSLWQYLRHLLSLLVQLLFVALLVLAVADPYFHWQLVRARRIVAVIDNSASMRATDVEPSRFEAAIREALATADGLRFRDEMAVVLAGPEPEVVLGMSGHVPSLKRALRSIEVSDNPTRLDSAIELGQQLIGEHPHGQVLVFTDGCAENVKTQDATAVDADANAVDDSSLPPAGVAVSVADHVPAHRVFGTAEAGNIGITCFQVRRSLIDPLGYEVLVAVRNASSHTVHCRLELELAGLPVDVLPLDLEPDDVFTRSLEKTSLEGGTLVAKLTNIRPAENDDAETVRPGDPRNEEPASRTLSHPDVNALPTDDQAWAILPPREVRNVLIVTPGNLFLQKVFEANPLVRVTVQPEIPEAWPTGGVIVLHRDVPTQLPVGDVLVVDPQNGCDAWDLGELMANPIVTQQDQESPLMTHVRLDNVLMPEARELRFQEPPHVLAGALAGGPVYAEVPRASGKCLVLSVNINQGDLAFRTAFPIMVTNALGWFAGQAGELRPALETGSMTEIELGDLDVTSGDLLLRSPSGNSRPLTVGRSKSELPAASDDHATAAAVNQAARISIPTLSECGVWSVVQRNTDDDAEEGTESLAALAVNLADDRETDLRTPIERIDGGSKAFVAGWLSRPIWFYLAAIACLLTVSEWWLYQRRVVT